MVLPRSSRYDNLSILAILYYVPFNKSVANKAQLSCFDHIKRKQNSVIGRRIRWSVQRRLSTLESVFSRRDVSRGSHSIFYPQEKEEKGNLSNKSIQMCNCHGLLIVRCVCRTVPAALPLYLTFPPSLVFMGNHNNNNCWSVLVRSTMMAACTTTEAEKPAPINVWINRRCGRWDIGFVGGGVCGRLLACCDVGG